MTNLKRNDIIFYYPDSLLGRWVAYLSGWASHCAVVENEHRMIQAEARFPICRRSYIDLQRDFEVFRIAEGIPFNKRKAWQWLRVQIKKRRRYDLLAFAGRLFNVAKWNRKYAYHCWEFVCGFLRAGGIDARPDMDDRLESPTDGANSNYLVKVGTHRGSISN